MTKIDKTDIENIKLISKETKIQKINKVKIKVGGGNGGHNGLLSIDKTIGNNYKRLRIGIGHPGIKEMVSSYVLEKFSNQDRELIDKKVMLLTKNFSLIFNDNGLLLTKIKS